MRRLTLALTAFLCAAALAAPAAQADFGIFGFDVSFRDAEGNVEMPPAGSHPYVMRTELGIDFHEREKDGRLVADGRIRDLLLEQMRGLVADSTAYAPCSTLEFLEDADFDRNPDCPLESQVGVTASSGLGWRSSSVFNLAPPPGTLLRIGWNVAGEASIVLDVGLTTDPPYTGFARTRDTPQVVEVISSVTELWGDPGDETHDPLRGPCLEEHSSEALPLEDIEGFEFESTGESCSASPNPRPFLTVPTRCGPPLATSFEASSWNGEADAGAALTHDAVGPRGFGLCGALPAFDPTIGAEPTSRAADSPTGLDFELSLEDAGLTSDKPGARAKSHIRKVVTTLPEGMTANPSLAEGLEVCSEGDLDDETLSSEPGEGCPEGSKIGTIEVDSPLVGETVHGSLYQAEPNDNLAEDSLIAFYIVLRNRDLGILVKQPVKVEPDSETGQLVATADEVPQLPFSSFRLKFREGGRSPLVTPQSCDGDPSEPGDQPFEVEAEITPWSGGAVARPVSTFELISGPNGSPCPPGGTPPFAPGFAAGTHNNAAGAFSPFSMRLTRRDGDQDLVRFDATLPPGALARLAGVTRCTDAQIARARAKSGREELRLPSCPANSRIGRVISGAGVGSQLTYVPGALYLAGPFAGAPFSVVGIVPAVAGPFDVGTVVVRQALIVNPRSGVVTADGSRSEPIPHILAGIPLRVRDIQVHVDRPGFTLNPTSCDPAATLASIWGGGSNPFSLLDDAPAPLLAARFQAAACASLGFAPRIGMRLRGGTRRGANPALRLVLRPRPGQANIERTIVRLPRSAFLDQAHIRTICTRVQFAASACPPGAIYGRAVAHTPLLDQPLAGPVYLRSSNNKLPDLVFDLKGEVEVEAAARIDSIRGGIRAITSPIPDAPLSKVVVRMQGGKKGLIVNSRNLCRGKARANVRFDAHNGKRTKLKPVVRPQCAKKKGKRGGGKRRGR